MTPYKQVYRHDPENGIYGDCQRTVVGCLLNIEPEKIPHWLDLGADPDAYDNWRANMDAWLAGCGLGYVSIPYDSSNHSQESILTNFGLHNPGINHIFVGKSRTGVSHCVIARDGEIVHDPSLDNVGIVGPCDDGFYAIELIALL